MPVDLLPVKDFIGLWGLTKFERLKLSSNNPEFYPPNLIDFAINPVPKFGARALNITHSYFDEKKNTVRSEYGFLIVKNRTKVDPRVHIGYLTTSSEGYSMMEQGFAKENKMFFHLKQFLRRSFEVGRNGTELDVIEVCFHLFLENVRSENVVGNLCSLEKVLELREPRVLELRLKAETNSGIEGYSAEYNKIMP
ncbi:unnamed protein product [Enterobius vermicularis]|uniref:DUF1794 domain-containing protein n=1 Tax=Enterobius vermicularis TaxID=51028 RepID=A0A0N4UTA4_ENTVE|nr:unnamed protein product [Enterobius vermicularis]